MKIKFFGKEFFSIDNQKLTLAEVMRSIDADFGLGKITPKNAYSKQPWVYACIRAITGNVIRAPFTLLIGEGESQREVVTGPAYDLFKNPNPLMSATQLWEGTQLWKQYRGEAFWWLDVIGTMVLNITLLNPDKMSPAIVNNILVGWKYLPPNGGQINIPISEIIHFKYLNPDNLLRGLSPLSAARKSLEIDSSARNFNQSILDKGSYPGSVLQTKNNLSDPQYERIVKKYEEKHKGESKAGRLMLLEGGLEYKEVRITAEDMKYIEQLGLSKDEIHAVFRVSIAITGDTSAYNRANMNTIRKDFWTQTIIPELDSMAAQLNNNLFMNYFKGIKSKFDTSKIAELQEDISELIQTAERMAKMLIPVAEINRALNLNLEIDQYDWLKTTYIPFSLVPIQEAGTAPGGNDDDKGNKDPISKMMKTFKGFLKKNDDVIKFKKWEKLIRGILPIERLYLKKLKKWIFDLRRSVLEGLDAKGKSRTKTNPLFNSDDELKKLQDVSKPFFKEAIDKGIKVGYEEVGLVADFEVVNVSTLNALKVRVDKLKEVTETISENVKKVLSEGVTEGSTQVEMADNMRSMFNGVQNRAETIVRTEINGAANEGKFNAFGEIGVTEHEWLNSMDEDVRDTHAISEIVNVGEPFSNGLIYPGDPNGSASEVINCRCTTLAIIK